MCEQYLGALKSNTLVISLGAGYNGVRVSITRNMHISRFISTLNKIKNITGLYIIVEAANYDWLEYASGNTTYENLFVVPNKKSIIPTINTHLDDLWQNEWSNLKGHSQTKYWFTMPDPHLAAKLMNLSREYLGKCIQFFTGHGWWNKHLNIANLNNSIECRLCFETDSVESPIHIFEECIAMIPIRQGLFNDPFPTQLLGRLSLCQVTELALVDSVCDLTDINHNHSNVSSTE